VGLLAGPASRVIRRSLAVVAVTMVALAATFVVWPRRYEVDGVSMGPGLLPGDVVASSWAPCRDRWRRARRFDRWIVELPDGSTGIKRLVGLPGERVSLIAGDLAIDARPVLKGPRTLAAVGSLADEAHAVGGGSWSRPPTEVLDDAPFASGEVSRRLLAVRDVGFVAEVTVSPAAAAAGPIRARGRAGRFTVGWRLNAAGRFAIVLGRLDGHAVAAAWPLPPAAGGRPDRRCLPAAAPERWPVTRPWPGPGEEPTAPELALNVSAAAGTAVVIERVTIWRDLLYRAAADGTTTWRLGPDEFLLLGDFPSGSRDSRHFGPLPGRALRHRIP